MPNAQRLSISSFHMDGKVMVWFHEVKSSKSVESWEEFTKAIQIRFGRGPYDDPMETLSKLKQEGALEDYKNQFNTLHGSQGPRTIQIPQAKLLSGRVEG
jgi:hypothetical protein